MLHYYQTRNLLMLFKRHSGAFYYAIQVGYTIIKAILNLLSGKKDWTHTRYVLRGIWDSLLGRMGKTFRPEDFV
jgi:hypothetical protein